MHLGGDLQTESALNLVVGMMMYYSMLLSHQSGLRVATAIAGVENHKSSREGTLSASRIPETC